MFNGLKISTRLNLLTSIVILILLAVGGTAIYAIQALPVEAHGNVEKILYAVTGVGIVFALLATVLVTGPLKRQVNDLQTTMTSIGKNNDLTKRANVTGNDELSEIARAFNALIGSIQDMINKVHEQTEELSSATTELSTTAAQVAQGSNLQSEAAASTASAVEEMTVSVASVSDSAEEVHQLAQESMAQSHKGNEGLSGLMGEIGAVENAVGEISNAVNEFVRSTASITNMTLPSRPTYWH
jgi:methyl-accepting chemotaxis protein